MKLVVIVTSVPPVNGYHGNLRRMIDMIKDLKRAGYDVHVSYHHNGLSPLPECFPHGVTWYIYIPRRFWSLRKRLWGSVIWWSNHLLNRFGFFINHPLGAWMDPAYTKYLHARFAERPPVAVIAEYVWMSGAFKAFPRGCRRLLDTHDVFANRKKHNFLNGVPCSTYSLGPLAERKGLNRAEVVLAISHEELDYFQTLKLRATVQLLEPSFAGLPPLSESPPGQNILFVASDNDANIQAGQNLLKAWARVDSADPKRQLHVVGLVCEAIRHHESASNVVFHGPVETLVPHYQNAAVSVVPLTAGTGMSIKTIESLFHGVPVLSSAVGARGLHEFVDHGIICYEDRDGLTDALTKLLANPEILANARARLQKRLGEYIARTTAQRAEFFRQIETSAGSTAEAAPAGA